MGHLFSFACEVIKKFMIFWCTADLEEMKQQAAAKEVAHQEKVLAHQRALADKLRKLENRCDEMRETEQRMKQQNADERRKFEIEKEEVYTFFFLHCFKVMSTDFEKNYPSIRNHNV